jgi:hypothetical protein
MIIDCNAHLGHWPFRDLPHTSAGEFAELMGQSGISQAVVAGYRGLLYGDVRPANEWLLEEVGGHSERFVPLATINPAFPKWEGDLQEAMEANFPGIALYPNYHGYRLDERCFVDLLDAVCDEDLFVRLHVRLEDERLHHPRCIVEPVELAGLAEPVQENPGARIMIANAKNAECGQIAGVLGEYENLFAEISHIEKVAGVELLADDIGADSVAFGTHAPLQYAESSLLKMKEGILDEAQRAAIFHENTVRWMGA